MLCPFCCEIDFLSPVFDQAIVLRDLVLRKPLDMIYTEDQITDEWDSYHFGAFVNHSLVGVLVLKPIDSEIIKMRQVAVLPELQGRGIGAYMVKYTEAWAIKNGYQKIELHARQVAQAFYSRLNYQKIGEEFLEVGLAHYKMTKLLK